MFDNITIQKAIVRNQQIKTKSAKFNLSADPDWKSAMENLRRAAYTVNAFCESSNLRVEDEQVDKSAVHTAIRDILALIGDVKGHKMYSNDAIACNVISYAGKEVTEKSAQLKDVEDNIRATRNYLRTVTPANSTEEFRKSFQQKLDNLLAQKKELESTEGHATSEPGRQEYPAFASKVENRLARAINEQNAKTNEQLDAEEAERKARRNAAAKARKAAKKAAESAK